MLRQSRWRHGKSQWWINVTVTGCVLFTSLALLALNIVWRLPPALHTDERNALEHVTPVIITLDGAPSIGSDSAPITAVLFMDLECPFCGRWIREVLPIVQRQYVASGKVRLIYKHFPLESVHPHARSLAVMSACANLQGRFWQMQDILFASRPEAVNEPALAKQGHLDAKALRHCVANEGDLVVDRDQEQGRNLGLEATPTIYVGLRSAGSVLASRRITGAWPPSVFDAAVAELWR